MAEIVATRSFKTIDGVVSATEFLDVATRCFKTTDGSVSAVEYLDAGHELAAHRHGDAQLMLVTQGLISCEVSTGLWMVPAQCAMWIPARMEHSFRGGVGNLQAYCVYIRPELM